MTCCRFINPWTNKEGITSSLLKLRMCICQMEHVFSIACPNQVH